MESIIIPLGTENTVHDYETVKGYSRGGLFIHRIYKDNKKWAVTHKKSGRKINRKGFPSRKQAFLFADFLNKLPVSWEILDMEDIGHVKNLKETIETFITRNIEKAS